MALGLGLLRGDVVGTLGILDLEHRVRNAEPGQVGLLRIRFRVRIGLFLPVVPVYCGRLVCKVRSPSDPLMSGAFRTGHRGANGGRALLGSRLCRLGFGHSSLQGFRTKFRT